MLAFVWNVPQLGSVTLIEVVWLLAGVVALAFTAGHLRPLRDDYAVARRLGEPGIIVAARGNLRRELLRFSFGLTICAVGMFAAAQPPVVPGPARVSEVGLLITAGLLWLGWGTALMSWWDWRDREEMDRLSG